jgi:hypothetical protein
VKSSSFKPESTDKDMKIAVSINNHRLFSISGFHPLSESEAMYRRLSSLRRSPPVTYFGRFPQAGQSTVCI